MNEVLAYLSSDQKEARHTALDIILAYTATEDARKIFLVTDCCKALLRCMPLPDPEGRLKILKCLINLSQDPPFIT